MVRPSSLKALEETVCEPGLLSTPVGEEAGPACSQELALVGMGVEKLSGVMELRGPHLTCCGPGSGAQREKQLPPPLMETTVWILSLAADLHQNTDVLLLWPRSLGQSWTLTPAGKTFPAESEIIKEPGCS